MQVAVLVGLDLEDQPTKRLVDVGFAFQLVVGVFRIDALHRRHVRGAGQVQRHRVKQRLNADMVQGRAAKHRHNQPVHRGFANHLVQQIRRHADSESTNSTSSLL